MNSRLNYKCLPHQFCIIVLLHANSYVKINRLVKYMECVTKMKCLVNGKKNVIKPLTSTRVIHSMNISLKRDL